MAKTHDNSRKPGLGSRTVSRRGFLRVAGAIGGAAALSTLPGIGSVKAANEFPGCPDSYGVLTDVTKCMGCRLCENACAQQNDLPKPSTDPAIFDSPRRTCAEAYTVVSCYGDRAANQASYRKIQCLHCKEPACVSACLVGALKKLPEGPVVYNEDVCMGCRYCMIACPYNSLSFSFDDPLTPAITKCTMCADEICGGGSPACASACPFGALTFGKRDALLEMARQRIRENPDQYVDHIYGETEAGGTNWLYLSAVPFDQLGLPTQLGSKPFVELTKGFLVAVPLLYVMVPPALAGISALTRRRNEPPADEEGYGHGGEER
jgi:formate dehydrogenase iron-sulfur subunit